MTVSTSPCTICTVLEEVPDRFDLLTGDDELTGIRERILQERLACIERISKAISSTLDLEDLLLLLMDQLTSIMRAERSTLYLVDRERGELWSKITKGDERLTIRLPLGVGVAGHVAREGETVNLEDAYAHPSFNPTIDRQTGFRTRALMAVPLRNNRGEVTGVVQVLNRTGGGVFDAADVGLLEALAAEMSMAIENAKLYRQAVMRNLELDALYEIEQAISSAHDPDRMLERVLKAAIGIFGAEAGSLLLLGAGKSAKLLTRPGPRKPSVWLQGDEIEPGRGIIGWVARHGESAHVSDPGRDGRFDPSLMGRFDIAVRKVLAVPLKHEGRTIGAVEMVNCTGKDRYFGDEEERLLRILGAQIARAVTVAREVRESRQRERLEAIGRMLSGVIHDFKTPMTVITGSVEMMIDHPDRDQRGLYAECALTQLDLLNKMTKDLMAFVRGDRNIFIRKVYMHAFLDEVAELVGAEFEGGSRIVVWHRDYDGTAWFDPDLMRRALLNIARNSLEALPEGGRLEIFAGVEEDRLVFTLRDNGPGIPAAIGDNLFDRFVTHGKEDGTGLGLAIVKQAVEDHRGVVEVDTDPSRGTTFTLRLPLKAEGR